MKFEELTLICRKNLEINSVVNCAGLKAREELAEKFKVEGKEVYVIGDCAGGYRIYNAVEDAWRVAINC